MGFTVYYQSTKPIPPVTRVAVNATAEDLCRGYTWLSCEPVGFFSDGSEGHMMGGVKPNFMPNPEDVADADVEDLPDGTISTALEVLCELSRQFDIDWEFSHDHDPGPIGAIHHGLADPQLQNQIAGIDSVREVLDEFDVDETPVKPRKRDDDDDGPTILKFGPIDK